MTEAKNYKETLNLPQTSFPMKASLAQREPEMLATWKADSVYETIRKKGVQKKAKYVLHDGPPYANGQIHIGHALNKILKDMIVKYKTMRGFDSLYVPGWDCHGLPIEYQCLKEMGKRKEEVERVDFRKQARKYAEKFVALQREDFKRLGIFAEWDKPYLTMDYGYQATIAQSFLSLAQKNYIYQGMKPVPWCFDCETALADAELEYEDKVSDSIYVKFLVNPESFQKVIGAPKKVSVDKKPVYFLVWTTTPWTLPANVGVALHPDLSYTVHIFSDQVWIFAESRQDHLESLEIGMGKPEIQHSLKGSELQELKYHHPFLDREGKVIMADYVSDSDGTGIVHIAPGHGEDDYRYGHLDNGLEILSPVDGKGRFTSEFQTCVGTHVFKANPMIIQTLEDKGLLLAKESHKHSYPHCWRCKKPILFRATKQWFMKIDHENLRQKMLQAISSTIQFTPAWGKNRIGSMVENRPEWCLSRQRYWGIPIPMIGCSKCKHTFFVNETKEKIVEIFTREGADSWFSHPVQDFLPHDFRCPSCQGQDFVKETDIIDVWFDSGVSHEAVLKKNEALKHPADLYLEGSDQHRGWFQSSLTTGMALNGTAPFLGVLTHGFVVDGEGRKMSKSSGNVVAPQDVIKEFGADILRLWVSSCDYQFDVRLSKEILKQLADSYRKIRNTFRYILGNLYDFDPSKDLMEASILDPLDQWAIEITNETVTRVTAMYDRFEFHQIYQEVHNFCVVQLSAYYFDALKDTLYTARKDSHIRRSAQTVLHYILSHLVRILAPILPFTMDEVWRSYSLGTEPSVLAADWTASSQKISEVIFQEWSEVRNLRNAIMPFLEKKREEKVIGSNLDAKIVLSTDHAELANLIQKNLKSLPRVFVASQVEWVKEGSSLGSKASFDSNLFKGPVAFSLSVEKADGKKCVRCWNYNLEVGKNTDHPDLCYKCVDAVSS